MYSSVRLTERTVDIFRKVIVSAYTRMRDDVFEKLREATQDFTVEADVELEPGQLTRGYVKNFRQFSQFLIVLTDLAFDVCKLRHLAISLKSSAEPPSREPHPMTITHLGFTLEEAKDPSQLETIHKQSPEAGGGYFSSN